MFSYLPMHFSTFSHNERSRVNWLSTLLLFHWGFFVCLICGKASCFQQKSTISIFCPPLWKHSVFDFVPLMPSTQLWPVRTWTGEADNDRGAVPFCSVWTGLNGSGEFIGHYPARVFIGSGFPLWWSISVCGNVSVICVKVVFNTLICSVLP